LTQVRAAPALPGPFWLIGCGNMAGAMLQGWLRGGLDPTSITVIRPSGRALPDARVRVLTEPPAGEVPALVMLGMKPYQLDDVAASLAARVGESSVVLSILAGVRLGDLEQRFPSAGAIVRVMPNTPCALGQGATSLHGTLAPETAQQVEALMAALGIVEWIDDEELFDAVSALTSSGPAFVFRFMAALAAAATDLGLPAEQAERMAVAMVRGSGALAAETGEGMHMLAERVASPGGMTRKGLDVLDADERLVALVRDTLTAATRRSREMGEEARRR
jgi:pyrroline-5-carboxylate reductase